MLPIPYFSVEQSSWADADDTGGRDELPVSRVRPTCPVDPSPHIGLDTHLHSPQRLAQLWTLDLKAQCEVWQLGAGPTECHFNYETGAIGCTPQIPLGQGDSWPLHPALTIGSPGAPTRADTREGSGHQAGPPGPSHTFDVV